MSLPGTPLGGVEDEESISCDVCRNGMWEDDVPIILCDGGCGAGVHTTCYGVLSVPAGEWKCASCTASVQPVCIACGGRKGMMKRVVYGSLYGVSAPLADPWMHVLCALVLDCTHVGRATLMEPLILDDATKLNARKRIRCMFCESKEGILMRCSRHPACLHSFHPYCAANAGLRLPLQTSQDKDVVVFCPEHQADYGGCAPREDGFPEDEVIGLLDGQGVCNFWPWHKAFGASAPAAGAPRLVLRTNVPAGSYASASSQACASARGEIAKKAPNAGRMQDAQPERDRHVEAGSGNAFSSLSTVLTAITSLQCAAVNKHEAVMWKLLEACRALLQFAPPGAEEHSASASCSPLAPKAWLPQSVTQCSCTPLPQITLSMPLTDITSEVLRGSGSSCVFGRAEHVWHLLCQHYFHSAQAALPPVLSQVGDLPPSACSLPHMLQAQPRPMLPYRLMHGAYEWMLRLRWFPGRTLDLTSSAPSGGTGDNTLPSRASAIGHDNVERPGSGAASAPPDARSQAWKLTLNPVDGAARPVQGVLSERLASMHSLVVFQEAAAESVAHYERLMSEWKVPNYAPMHAANAATAAAASDGTSNATNPCDAAASHSAVPIVGVKACADEGVQSSNPLATSIPAQRARFTVAIPPSAIEAAHASLQATSAVAAAAVPQPVAALATACDTGTTGTAAVGIPENDELLTCFRFDARQPSPATAFQLLLMQPLEASATKRSLRGCLQWQVEAEGERIAENSVRAAAPHHGSGEGAPTAQATGHDVRAMHHSFSVASSHNGLALVPAHEPPNTLPAGAGEEGEGGDDAVMTVLAVGAPTCASTEALLAAVHVATHHSSAAEHGDMQLHAQASDVDAAIAVLEQQANALSRSLQATVQRTANDCIRGMVADVHAARQEVEALAWLKLYAMLFAPCDGDNVLCARAPQCEHRDCLRRYRRFIIPTPVVHAARAVGADVLEYKVARADRFGSSAPSASLPHGALPNEMRGVQQSVHELVEQWEEWRLRWVGFDVTNKVSLPPHMAPIIMKLAPFLFAEEGAVEAAVNLLAEQPPPYKTVPPATTASVDRPAAHKADPSKAPAIFARAALPAVAIRPSVAAGPRAPLLPVRPPARPAQPAAVVAGARVQPLPSTAPARPFFSAPPRALTPSAQPPRGLSATQPVALHSTGGPSRTPGGGVTPEHSPATRVPGSLATASAGAPRALVGDTTLQLQHLKVAGGMAATAAPSRSMAVRPHAVTVSSRVPPLGGSNNVRPHAPSAPERMPPSLAPRAAVQGEPARRAAAVSYDDHAASRVAGSAPAPPVSHALGGAASTSTKPAGLMGAPRPTVVPAAKPASLVSNAIRAGPPVAGGARAASVASGSRRETGAGVVRPPSSAPSSILPPPSPVKVEASVQQRVVGQQSAAAGTEVVTKDGRADNAAGMRGAGTTSVARDRSASGGGGGVATPATTLSLRAGEPPAQMYRRWVDAIVELEATSYPFQAPTEPLGAEELWDVQAGYVEATLATVHACKEEQFGVDTLVDHAQLAFDQLSGSLPSHPRAPVTDPKTGAELFCICQQPHDGKRMFIGCDCCGGWYHLSCVGVSPLFAKHVILSYACRQCAAEHGCHTYIRCDDDPVYIDAVAAVRALRLSAAAEHAYVGDASRLPSVMYLSHDGAHAAPPPPRVAVLVGNDDSRGAAASTQRVRAAAVKEGVKTAARSVVATTTAAVGSKRPRAAQASPALAGTGKAAGASRSPGGGSGALVSTGVSPEVDAHAHARLVLRIRCKRMRNEADGEDGSVHYTIVSPQRK